MATDLRDNTTARVDPFFDALLTRDGAGGSWLPALLAASPHGRERFGELADGPGWLHVLLAVRGASGRRAALDYPAAPTRELLAWFIDHPDELTWPSDDASSVETVRLRHALIGDEPPGVRARAQDRAHDLLRRSAPLGHAWWRFEDPATLHCVLMTDRLVVVIEGRRDDEPGPSTPWFPRRSELVRDLEAARRLSEGKAWGTLLISDTPLAAGTDGAVAAAVAAGAPQLDPTERDDLAAAYLGNLTWDAAAAAVGLRLGSLPGWDR